MNSDTLWQSVLSDLELTLSKAEFTTWLKNTSLEIDPEYPKIATVIAPEIFAKEWIKKKYHDGILTIVKKAIPEVENIEYDVKSKGKRKKIEQAETPAENSSTDNEQNKQSTDKGKDRNLHKKSEEVYTQKPSSAPIPTFKAKAIPSSNRPYGIKQNYTFENYIVGSNSELAFAAAQSVVGAPGETYNPLYIYGGVGLGKTHLLQATGNALFQNQNAKVMYLPSEIFLSEIVAAIKKGSIEELKLKYRTVDVLILDDIQIISGKEKFQEIFFDTFNALYSQGKQIILSSDCLPSDIPALEDRLRSRFHGGMIADISLPDVETRMAILRLKVEKLNFFLPEDTIEYIATHLASNIRQMEGSLNRLVTQCQLRQQEATLEYAKEVLMVIAKESTALQKKASPNTIINLVGEHYNVTPSDIKGKSRKKEIVFPRQIVMFILRKDNELALPTIGRMIGGRDHSTVIHSIEKIENLRNKDSNVEKDIKNIRQKLRKAC